MKEYMKIWNWIYKNLRPLDIARWQYHFEKGNKEDVLKALSTYQNEDGGFGHALEPDSWNPNSSPIQTWVATEILKEIDYKDKEHPIIRGILKYLKSGADFKEGFWLSSVLSNNDYPHAPWWHTDINSTSQTSYNPTACLAGFGLCYSDLDSKLHKKCKEIVAEAVNKYLEDGYLESMHTVNCYLRLMEYCEQVGIKDLFEIFKLKEKLIKQVKLSITKDKCLWEGNYICKPSQFFNSQNSIFYETNKEIGDYECEYIVNSRNVQGVWDITWSWNEYPSEWAISENWWKGNLVICNMLYLKNFKKL
ncbi:MAG TPA: hypothetical protein VIK72_03505 [Clostridiaceae bacterium]